MNQTPTIDTSELLHRRQPTIWKKFLGIQNRPLPSPPIAFEGLLDQYKISETVLWDCLSALKVEPLMLNGKAHLTASNLKRLEQFLGRIELVWHCPQILSIRYR